MKRFVFICAVLAFTYSCGSGTVSDGFDGKSLSLEGQQWIFHSAGLSPHPSTGTASAVALATDIPSSVSCGWWECEFPVTPGEGARFTAIAEITPGKGVADVYNDVMMFVKWYDPAKGNRPGVGFYQRDYMRYTDEFTPDGRIIRRFDDTFAVPGDCNTIQMELIAKWHEMKISYRNVRVETVAAPGKRLVRCVVGNPFEKNPKEFGLSWDDPKAVVSARLDQIETSLKKIAAEVDHPDMILFSEGFVGTGAPKPREVAEKIPDGPSFRLASKYARLLHSYVAMNVKEESDEGTYHLHL